MTETYFLTEDGFVKEEKPQADNAEVKHDAAKTSSRICKILPQLLTVGSVVTPIILLGVMLIRVKNGSRLRRPKEILYYDRSIGAYWCLKRALSNADLTEIDKIRRNGESLAQILEDLKVLK